MRLRFIRVPFGLNVSPFLLGGTIQSHLQTYVSNRILAQLIQENLYVDNLILTGDTPHELAQKIEASDKIFCNMNMNLRKFLSNTTQIKGAILQEKCSRSKNQKVLGIFWQSENDILHISCKFLVTNMTTKPTITHQISSICDPLGLRLQYHF